MHCGKQECLAPKASKPLFSSEPRYTEKQLVVSKFIHLSAYVDLRACDTADGVLLCFGGEVAGDLALVPGSGGETGVTGTWGAEPVLPSALCTTVV